MPPYAHFVDVHPFVSRRKLLDGCDLIRQSIVTHVAIVGIVKRLGAPWRAHGINFNDDKPEFGHGLFVAARGTETATAHTA